MPIDLLKTSLQPKQISSQTSNQQTTGRNLLAEQKIEPLSPEAGMAGSPAAEIGKSLISSEINFGKDLGQALYLMTVGQKKIDDITKQYLDSGSKLVELAKQTTDQTRKQKLLGMAKGMFEDAAGTSKNVVGELRTNKQIAGDAAGVLMDIALGGGLAKGAKSFNLLKGAQTAVKGAEVLSTGQKIAQIAKGTAKATGVGAGLGYGMDVTQAMQEDKSVGEILTPGWGTALGAAAPLTIGGVKLSATALRNPENAGRVINSLIKPLAKDFSYGKNPGRTVAKEGIIANNFEDLASRITERKKEIGAKLGEVTSQLEGKATLDLNKSLSPIDDAISKAQSAPRTNASLITRLQAVKDDLMGATVDALGNKTMTKNLGNASFKESVGFKELVGDLTKWTGSVSDDQIVNKALKQVYGKTKEQLLNKAEEVAPKFKQQISILSEKYADLISAEVATKYRDKIAQRASLVSMPVKVGTAAGLIGAVATGGAGIPAILSAISVGILDKAMESPAFKTRLASWLSKASPTLIEKIYQKNPAVANAVYKLFYKDNKSIDKGVIDAVKSAKKYIKANPEGGFVKFPTFKQGEIPTTTGVDNVLSQEARKYKTAEEFVKRQGTPVYHGSPKSSIIEKEGFSLKDLGKGSGYKGTYGAGVTFTTDIGRAKLYGDVVEARIPKNLKLFETEDPVTDLFANPKIKDVSPEGLSKTLKETGYDGVQVGDEIIVFDSNIPKTKSQLTDIWEKANKKK